MVTCNHIEIDFSDILWLYITIWRKIMISNVNHALALRIKELLEQKNMTRYRLAMNSGVNHSTLKNIIHETIKDNLLSTAILIARGFDMSVSAFFDSPLFEEEFLNI